MAAFLYLLLTFVFSWLFFRLWKLRRASQTRAAGGLILQLVLFSLVYDSLVIAVGSLVGENELLLRLNLGRYVFFAVFTPLLMITGTDFAARAGVIWAEKWYFQVVIWLAAMSLVAQGGVLVWQYKDALVAQEVWGALRYVPDISFFPFAALLTDIVLIFLGGLIWWKNKWPWMMIGAVVLLVGSAFSPSLVGPWLSSGTLGVLAACLVATETRLLTPVYSLTESELMSRISPLAGRSKKK